MNFEQYRQDGRAKYESFVVAVLGVLDAILREQGVVPHSLTGRAKESGSLRKKLADRKIGVHEPLGDKIKDLAGCRVVFLTNSQVSAFNHTGALHDNFDILDVNVHHPVPGTENETNLFDSTHYLVRLKPERLVLPEYRRFDGMRAEIQIQTLLNHAWAEMGHDTIYKEPELKHLGKARMQAIGERMNRVMQEHLKPAGHDFDKIARDFQQLVKADAAAEASIETVKNTEANNELEAAIEILADLVLPHYDEPAKAFLALLDGLVDAVERSRDKPVVPIDTEYGQWPGKTSLDVARQVQALVVAKRYADPRRTFAALARLYRGAVDGPERELWLEAGKTFAAHDLHVWQQVGPAIPQTIIDGIAAFDPDEDWALLPLVATMLGEMLAADLEGTTWRSDSLNFNWGAVGATAAVRGLRSAAIDWLERWLDHATSDADRRPLLGALRRATRLPDRGEHAAALVVMIMEDAARIEEMVIARVSGWGLELRRSCEIDALRIHHRFHRLGDELAADAAVAAAQERLMAAVLGLRDRLNADDEYLLYKTLVGYDSVHPGAWDGEHFSHRAAEAWRQQRFAAMIADIEEADVDGWLKRIDDFIDAVATDGGHLLAMRDFLRQLARERPEIALAMLADEKYVRDAFVSSMLHGLDEAGRGADVTCLANAWIADGRFLAPLGDYLRFRAGPDIDLLEAHSQRAIALADECAVAANATAAAVWYQKAADRAFIDRAFMPAVRFFLERRLSRWIDNLWAGGQFAIVSALTAEESAELLASFVEIDKVTFAIVRILGAVAEHYPDQAVGFFVARIRRSQNAKDHRFDPVPFDAFDLSVVFAPHAHMLVAAMHQLYREIPEYHQYRGGRLISHAFPDLGADLSEQLAEIVRQGDTDEIKFVLKTLSTYEGVEAVYPLCLEIVERLDPGDKLLARVEEVLGATGVIAGEFGMVEIYNQRRELIVKWRDDPRPRVRDFATARARELQQSMAWEQRRAAGDVAQRKRDWNEE